LIEAAMTASAEILIADDHALFRKGFGLLLRDVLPGVEIREVAGFDAALDLLAGSPQVTGAFFDLLMPGMAGPDSIRAVREAYPNLHFAAITGLEDRGLALQVIDAGANGYILKSSPEEEIVRAVNRVMAGETYLPSVLPHTPDKAAWTPPDISLKAEKVADLPLTHRQRDVISQLANGLSNKEIARQLGLAEGTVKVHLAAIFRVLAARNRTDAVLKAAKLVAH
jgi:DNA-binding NarL/FixJ family response regulator